MSGSFHNSHEAIWITEMAKLVRDGRSGTDLWVNEAGYSDYRYRPNLASKFGVNVIYRYEHTPASAANALFKDFTMALASHAVSLAGWYRVDDFDPSKTHFSDDEVNYHLGILDQQGRPKPAYFALRFFNRVLGQPLRTLPVPVGGAQRVLQAFQRKDGKVVVVGWLRSTRYDEVSEHSGRLDDKRREVARIPLPCRAVSDLRFFGATGRAAPSSARFRSGELENVVLRGDRVFIAEMGCSN